MLKIYVILLFSRSSSFQPLHFMHAWWVTQMKHGYDRWNWNTPLNRLVEATQNQTNLSL